MIKILSTISVNQTDRELVVDAGFAFLVRILGALAALIATFFVARQLGAVESGYYFLAFSIVSVLAAISRGGLDNTLIRFVAADSRQALSVFKKSIIYCTLLSSFVAAGLYVMANYLAHNVLSKPELTPVLKYISVGVPGLALLTLCANSLQGMRLVSKSIFVLNIAINLCLVLGVYWFEVTTAQSLALVYSLASLIIALIGAGLFLFAIRGEKTTEFSWGDIFSSCMPLWLVVIMGQLVQWAGQFFAGVYLDVEAVALLAVAQRLAMLSSFVLIAINLVVAPRFSTHYKRGEMRELASLAKKSVVLTSVLAMPVVCLMLIFPELLLGFFGADFIEGAPLLRIMALGQFVNVITGSVGYLLIMTGHERDLRNVTMVSGVAALILAWGLTAYIGIVGAAVGTAVAVATQNLFAVYFVRKRLGINTLSVWR